MMQILLPLLVALVGALVSGALVYGFAAGKLTELGRLMFFAGLLVLVLVLSHRWVHLP